MRQIAEDVLKERYYQPGEKCWSDVAWRVANYIGNDEVTREEYYQAISGLELIPNSPALMNAGTSNPQMSACFCVPVGDSKEEIFDAVKYAAIIHSSGGGTGFNFSSIRAKGSPVGGTGKAASGPISFMHVFNAATETIKQGGKRRGANLGSLDVHHPDIKEFITCKSKEGELSNFNISVILDDAFMRNPDPEIWDLIVDGNWKNGEPGILFKEARERDNKRPDLGELSETNPCVRGDTLILTDFGYVRIEDVVNKLINVWNGFEYSAVTPKITGYNQHCLKIGFSDGSELTCTDYHEFEIITGYNKSNSKSDLAPSINVKAIDLKIGDKLQKCKFPIIKDTVSDCLYEPYTQGFFAGDGFYDNTQKKNFVHVHDDKQRCIDSISHSHRYNRPNGRIVTLTLSKELKPRDFVPDSSYSVSDRLEFLAGLIDSDGCAVKSESGGIQISSVNHQFLIDVKLMINTLGENTKVTLMNPEDVRDIKGQFYYCVDCYRLIIPQSVVWNLMELGLKTRRVELPNIKPNRNASQFVKVVKIEDAGIEPVVYCFTEPKNHTGIFNGIFTRQCGETALFPWESCNLASINLMSCFIDGEFNWDKFASVVRLGVRFLNDMLDKTRYPLPQIEEATKRTRKIGLGVMGFADLLITCGMRYGDEESLEFADMLFRVMREVAEHESALIGGKNTALLSIAPTGSISLFAGVSSGIEPNFGYVYNRSTWASGDKTTYREVHPMFEEVIKKSYQVTDDYSDYLLKYAEEHGTIQGCFHATPEISRLFVTAKDISPMDHVRMQATIQKHVDQAISKTVLCAPETTKEEIGELIKYAWESGCKGLTIYREGSRSDVVLETNATKHVEEKKPDKKEPVTIPREIDLKSIRMNSACGVLWVKTGFLRGSSDPIEVWVDAEKGGCRANLELIGRLISKMLQEGINYEVACKQGDKVFCAACVNNVKNESEGYSCANLISKGIKEGIKKREEDLLNNKMTISDIGKKYDSSILNAMLIGNGIKCPECGAKLNRIEGCFTCSSCGYSRCK